VRSGLSGLLAPLALCVHAGLLGCSRTALRVPPEGAEITLPADHGPHESAQTEWWHLHADVRDTLTGEPAHFFAGFIAQRTDLDRALFVPIRLGVNPFHAAYAQVVTGGRSWTSDRHNFPDHLAARFRGDGLNLRHSDWRVDWTGGAAHVEASAGPHEFELVFTPTRPAVLPGDGGRVELLPGTIHQWVQMEEMAVRGRWKDGRQIRWVDGVGFYKHQWGRLYHEDVEAFLWLSFDLPDQRSVVLVWVGTGGALGVPGSQGWVSQPDGSTAPLPIEDIAVRTTRTWRSGRSGATWPVAWEVEDEDISLRVETVVDDEELWVFPAAFYAGPAAVRGEFRGTAVDLQTAFVEQLGADMPIAREAYRSRPPPR